MTTEWRSVLKTVFQEAIKACSPDSLLPPLIEISPNGIRIAGHDAGSSPLHLFASGKAAVSMASACHKVLGKHLAGGVIVSPEPAPSLPPIFRHFTGAHPVPDDRSFLAGREIMRAMAGLSATDQFIYLLSGGSSALMEVPVASLSMADIAFVTEVLVKSGLPIEEINRIRIHLSRLKGGGLGNTVQATGIVLVMSDVLRNPLPLIGSGPFIPVERNYMECANLLRQRKLWGKLPGTVRDFFTNAATATYRKFRQFPHKIIADNKTMLRAVQTALENRNIPARIADEALAGEAEKTGRQIADFAAVTAATLKTGEKMALLFSGETTVNVRGNGLGGRCQELALAALTELRGNPAVTVFAAGSDGRDGPTDAAGAIADSQTWEKSRKMSLSPENFLTQNDSYHFFHSTGSLIKTDPTGINLLDIVIALIQGRKTVF